MKICIHREPQNVVKNVLFGQDDGYWQHGEKTKQSCKQSYYICPNRPTPLGPTII